MIQKLKSLLIVAVLACGIASFSAPIFASSASALTASSCTSGKLDPNNPNKCAALGSDCSSGGNCFAQTPLAHDLQTIVSALAAGVGVVVVGSIIVGGIQYIVAGDNSSGVAEAKKRITNSLVALAVFMVSYAFLQWLIPGGIF